MLGLQHTRKNRFHLGAALAQIVDDDTDTGALVLRELARGPAGSLVELIFKIRAGRFLQLGRLLSRRLRHDLLCGAGDYLRGQRRYLGEARRIDTGQLGQNPLAECAQNQLVALIRGDGVVQGQLLCEGLDQLEQWKLVGVQVERELLQ